jgi:hypothetical protein
MSWAVVAVAVQAELVQDGLQKGFAVKGRGGHCRDFSAEFIRLMHKVSLPVSSSIELLTP